MLRTGVNEARGWRVSDRLRASLMLSDDVMPESWHAGV